MESIMLVMQTTEDTDQILTNNDNTDQLITG
jgi:hypothetical protein